LTRHGRREAQSREQSWFRNERESLFDTFLTTVDRAIGFFENNWVRIQEFFNSVFFTSITGAAAGAIAGAIAAQRIADRSRNKAELLKEIRATNLAITNAVSAANTAIAAKKQLIKPMMKVYKEQVDEYQQSLRNKPAMYEFQAYFMTLPELRIPIAALQAQTSEKISLNARGIALVNALEQAVDGLNRSILKRNELIQQYMKARLTDTQLLALYFGAPLEEGKFNQEYPNAVEAIYRQCDDVIFFSVQLCDELMQHGTHAAKQFGKRAPDVVKVDFATPREACLMPDDNDYAGCFTGFVKKAVRS